MSAAAAFPTCYPDAVLADNGTQAGSLATSFVVNSVEPFGIGATQYPAGSPWPGWQDFFLGQIDDVALYNRALMAAEVQLHYDSGRQ